MSGIEIAGLAIGVIPIVVEILKSYSTAKRRLQTFSRHADVVQDILLRFRVAAASFNNDCRLLLQAVVARPGDVAEMIDDPMHAHWQEQAVDIEKGLRSLLHQDYDLCQNMITRLRDILREIQDSLIKLEKGLENHHETTRRIWHAFNTMRKENEYIRQLDALDKWNKSLSKLRKQRCKIQKRRNVSTGCIYRKSVPRGFQQIRVASQQLGESLHDSWSCTNTSHSGHQAKLSLDAKSGHDDVQLDIVVACQPKLAKAHPRPSPDLPIWLQIRSITSLTTLVAPSSSSQTLINTIRKRCNDQSPQVITKTMPKASKSKKRVRFGDDKDDDKRLQAPRLDTTLTSAQSFIMLDLKTTESVCCHITKVRSLASACQDGCMGYLEVSKTVPTTRFMFYDASKLATKAAVTKTTRQEAISIKSVVHNLQILQQLTLAKKLAEAVLQYHSTSWLPQAFTLQDVAYFKSTTQSNSNDISDALDSLHLSNRFPVSGSTNAGEKQGALDLKHTYGIRNLTLAKLGVALLEICAQKDITGSSLDHTPHAIIEARKLLDERHHSIMTLGDRYLEIVRKCIHCDFSCNDDLNDEALQSAVYTEVVCALQEMRMQWEKLFGI